MSQQTTLGRPPEYTYRTIVKDAYSTRDGGGDTRVEVMAWKVDQDQWLDGTPGREGIDPEEAPGGEDAIMNRDRTLRYDRILDEALDDLGAEEISRRTELKSYRDDRGGRAESTIRGYKYNPERLEDEADGGVGSDHPVKRVLRRYARSRDLGHYEDGESRADEPIELPPRGGEMLSGKIDLQAIKRAFRLARSIASENGLVFVDRSGDGQAVEDNERIDEDEIRRYDRPIGDVKAACLLIKPDGQTYEYKIDLDSRDLERVDVGKNNVGRLAPEGW